MTLMAVSPEIRSVLGTLTIAGSVNPAADEPGENRKTTPPSTTSNGERTRSSSRVEAAPPPSGVESSLLTTDHFSRWRGAEASAGAGSATNYTVEVPAAKVAN